MNNPSERKLELRAMILKNNMMDYLGNREDFMVYLADARTDKTANPDTVRRLALEVLMLAEETLTALASDIEILKNYYPTELKGALTLQEESHEQTT